MKLKLTVARPENSEEPSSVDVVLTFDVTATIDDAACALLRTGMMNDSELETAAEERVEALTLRARSAPGEPDMLLDPGSPIVGSGLRSGWIVEPVREFDTGRRQAPGASRAIDLVGRAEILTGRQSGVSFGLVAGANLIGRGRGCRVRVSDPSVSRRHAVVSIEAGDFVLRDLGSANGLLVAGQPVEEVRIRTPVTALLGSVEIRIVPGPPPRSGGDLTRAVGSPPPERPHLRSPVLTQRFPESTVTLPTPPAEPTPMRIPTIALIAPILLGIAMYVFTRSVMSLVMVAFSPLMMVASWFDVRFGIARRRRRELRSFEGSLQSMRDRLTVRRAEEAAGREREAPSIAEVADAIVRRSTALWCRRPQDATFLELRVGDALLPSRTEIQLPDRGSCGEEAWSVLQGFASGFASAPAPALVRLGTSCGALGVCGSPVPAAGALRALILHIAGLHSPAEVTIACLADERSVPDWRWLQWLPHVDTVMSPIRVPQCACTEGAARRLISALEREIEERLSAPGNGPKTGEPILPSIVLLVIADTVVETARLIRIAEVGPQIGVHVVWFGREHSRIPAACRHVIAIGESRGDASGAPGRIESAATNTSQPLQRIEFLSHSDAERLARLLAPVEDEAALALDDSDLPASVELRDLHEADLLEGGSAILRSWQGSGSLNSLWQPGTAREAIDLSAVVGQGLDGPVRIDLRAQGPHALVGGTTGSGKSEFLQTWIVSLAARISPDRLTFLLVDYKGGAAFAECTKLPHTVGLVTDLTPLLVRRALTSLRAEVRRREALLAERDAKDLATLERRSDPATPPSLVIVIDEFAALAAEVPEFVEGVVDIAQRGRSLGLHLILATQRPAGVISGRIRANTSIRVALRFSDEEESRDVIGAPDAARFEASTPGRAALRAGPGDITHFQAAHLGGRESEGSDEHAVGVDRLGFSAGESWSMPAHAGTAAKDPAAPVPLRDIERARDGIAEAARLAGLQRPRRPWLEPLPERIGIGEITQPGAAVWGLRDRPAEQSQPPLIVDLDAAQNIAIFGAGGTGKTSALVTLAATLSTRAAEEPVNIYAIDAAGGGMSVLAPLPTVGAIAPLADGELVGRILRHALRAIEERGPRRETSPRIVLLVDGFAALRQEAESSREAGELLTQLAEVMARGRTAGVHVVLGCERATALPPAIEACVQQRFALRLANPNEYGFLGIRPERLADAPPGRAVLLGDGGGGGGGGGDEVQFAYVEDRSELEEIAAILSRQCAPTAVPIRALPPVITLVEVPRESEGLPVIGLELRELGPATMPLSGLGVVSGPAGSGRTSAMLACVAALERWSEQRCERVESILLTLVEADPDGLAGGSGADALRGGSWTRVARGEDEVRDLAASLAAALGGTRLASLPESLKIEFPSHGARGVIVVERPEDAEGTPAMAALVDLARAARRAGVLVLFEFEQGGASSDWELFSALKRPKWGIALLPEHADGREIFRSGLWDASVGRSRGSAQPGRGYVVQAGRASAVQIAVAQGILCS